MSDDFDFDAAERELAFSTPAITLRERAAVAFIQHQADCERDILVAAADIIDEILEVDSARDAKHLKVHVNLNGSGYVDMVIDNILFRAELKANGESELEMKSRHGFVLVRSLEDVGRQLAQGPCYVTQPESDGRGSE